jgi:putative ABC transport system permease protein
VYLSALERQRDFAVFKATGVATRSILGGMVLQAALLSVVAALIGSVIATLLGPRFPMIVSLQLRAHLLLPFLATAIGLLASLAGMRRVVAVDPALAFGGP